MVLPKQPLTKGIRKDIEQRVKIAGGISGGNVRILLFHIDLLKQLLEEVIENGPEWGDEEWSVFIKQALFLLDEVPVRG